MIDDLIKTDDIILKLFDYDNDEWERVRGICLQENNWLRENYLPHRCKITDHKVFFIAYNHSNDPIMFGGLKEYNPNVARAFNRFYVFPRIRSASHKRFNYHLGIMAKTILPCMENALPQKYNLLFISMQMRKRGYEGDQTWWNFWKKSWLALVQDWKSYDEGLVCTSTKNSNQPENYQNIVYRDSLNFKFSNWNPKTIDFQQYNLLSSTIT